MNRIGEPLDLIAVFSVADMLNFTGVIGVLGFLNVFDMFNILDGLVLLGDFLSVVALLNASLLLSVLFLGRFVFCAASLLGVVVFVTSAVFLVGDVVFEMCPFSSVVVEVLVI